MSLTVALLRIPADLFSDWSRFAVCYVSIHILLNTNFGCLFYFAKYPTLKHKYITRFHHKYFLSVMYNLQSSSIDTNTRQISSPDSEIRCNNLPKASLWHKI